MRSDLSRDTATTTLVVVKKADTKAPGMRAVLNLREVVS